MLPKYSFDYFIQRCQALGSHKRITVSYILFRLTCQKSEKFTKGKMFGKRLYLPKCKTKKINLSRDNKNINRCIMEECLNKLTRL